MSAVLELASSPHVIIQARGNNISIAVRVSHILVRKTNNVYQISDVKLGEEEITQKEDGKKKNVSTIQIIIEKKSSENDSSENQNSE